MLTESHEKKAAWAQIWFLSQQDDADNYKYYKGLTLDERNSLLKDLYDFLDYERAIEVSETGKTLGEADNSPSEREDDDEPAPAPTPAVKPLEIHSPEHYSFGEKKLWIPWAEDGTSGAKRGSYAKGYPTGMVLHWTAGHRNGLQRGNDLMRNTGMLYLIGDKDGNLGQSDSLRYHGYHAGKSSHRFASGYVSDEWVGLELQAAGHMRKKDDGFYSWWGDKFPDEEIVYSERRENIAAGHYHLYTEAQMLLTRKLVCWLYLNNPNVFSIDRVCGHDEVSPGRKVDPGASPTEAGKVLTMSEFRKLCWNDVDKITELKKQS